MNNEDFRHILQVKYPEQQMHMATVTFQITDDCCLNCSYCYQIHKGHKMMTIDIFKKDIDLLFKMYEKNDPNAVINKSVAGLYIQFIGGEPLMNIEVMYEGSKYFLNKCIELDHIWLTNTKFIISTNGLLYFSSKVQKYLIDFRGMIILSLTIDGEKNFHDSCRIDKNGRGSFDKSYAAFSHFSQQSLSQMVLTSTIAPKNLKYLSRNYDFFSKLNCIINTSHPILEYEWTVADATEYYYQLKNIANKILIAGQPENGWFYNDICCPISQNELNHGCGGTGNMITFLPDGNITTCIRFSESTVGTEKAIIIGNTSGFLQTQEQKEAYNKLKVITDRKEVVEEKCYTCPIARGCSRCLAWNYQQNGTINKYSTNICWMHRAFSLINTYYWNNYYINAKLKQRIPIYLPYDIAIQIIGEKELDLLIKLSSIPR